MLRLKTNLKPVSGTVEVIPLVDLVLLLLIFFILTSPLVFQQGVPVVTLPYTSNFSLASSDKLVVYVNSLGEDPAKPVVFIKDRKLNWKEFTNNFRLIIQEEIRKNEQLNNNAEASAPPIMLYADETVTNSQLMTIYTLARGLGAQVFLVTSPVKPRNSTTTER